MRVTILGESGPNAVIVQVVGQGGTHTVLREKLLPIRGAFFGVRGQVLTTSPSHNDEEGKIIATAMSKSTKTFYKVQFRDGSVEWFNEDQVFIDITKLRIV